MPPRSPDLLRENQRLISQIIQDDPAKLVILKMSGGKTAATLDALYERLSSLESNHVLIVAPWFVAKNTWPDEIKAWSHTQALSCAIAVGDADERAAAIERRAEITTINFENLPWLAKHLKTINNWYWDTVVIDESTRLAAGEGRTKRTKIKQVLKDGTVVRKVRPGGNQTRFGIITTARRKIERVIELTGTPGDPKKLWAQAYLLDQGEALGRDKSVFESRYYDKNPYTHGMTEKPGAETEILRRMEHLAVTIPAQGMVPEPIMVPMKVKLPKKAMDQYAKFQRDMFAEEWDVEAVSRGVLANKLLQAANGCIYKEDRSVVEIHDEKLRALEELIETAGDESVLTFYSFQFDVQKIRKRFPNVVVAKEYRGDLIGDWNKGRIKHLLAHPATLGHGTNMQDGGHIFAWYGLTFNLEYWLQANARLPRPGQREQVYGYPIIAEGTYDERALKVLEERNVTQDRVINHFIHERFR